MSTIVHLSRGNTLTFKTQAYWMLSRAWHGRRAPGDRAYTVLEALHQCNEIIRSAPMTTKLYARAMALRQAIVEHADDGKTKQMGLKA